MKTDIAVLFATFLTGVLAGSFIYFTGFREIDIDPKSHRSVTDFEIIVTEYGGCGMVGACTSYRLLNDGTFVSIGDSGDFTETQLRDVQLTTLQEALASADLQAQAAEIEPEFCEAWVDGIDYEYDITVGTDRYILDTCTTAVDIDHTLIEFLDDLFRDL